MPSESPIPNISHETSRRFATRLALFYGAIFGLLGAYLPFFPVWLKAVGIEASWIGIITAVPAVTRFTVLPFVTGLAERRQSLRTAIILASALIQGSHAAYYIFASIVWKQSGLGGLTIAGLWSLGVLAEIVLFALSPRFTLPYAVLVVIGALSAVARWIITAQDPPIAMLAVVQLAHGLTFGLTQVGTMGLLVHHVPGHVMARW